MKLEDREYVGSWDKDPNYFNRYFLDPETRVVSKERVVHHAQLTLGLLQHFGVAVESVLDVGCGCAWWREPSTQAGAMYCGVDVNPASGADLREDFLGLPKMVLSSLRSDLVVCQGVFHEYSDADAEECIRKVRFTTVKAMSIMNLTKADLKAGRTEQKHLYLRSLSWYESRLLPGFEKVARGLYVRKAFLRKALELG